MAARIIKTLMDVASKTGGGLYWLKDVAELLEELKSYKEAEEQGLIVRLPCKVGDIVYADSTILPIEDMWSLSEEGEVNETEKGNTD